MKEIDLIGNPRNSLLYWYPKIRNLGIPTPRTKTVKLSKEEIKLCRGEMLPPGLVDKVKNLLRKFEYPVFIRTDLSSGKHSWKKSCFVRSEKDIRGNLHEVIILNLLSGLFGLPFRAIAVREYIPLDSKFVGFLGDMPVARERRYFIRDGKVQCRHPYWVEDAVAQGTISYSWNKLPQNWREILKEINTETEEEVKLLTSYAEKVAMVLEGYWSVDFAKAKDGRWILIDMGLGDVSYHFDGCKFKNSQTTRK